MAYDTIDPKLDRPLPTGSLLSGAFSRAWCRSPVLSSPNSSQKSFRAQRLERFEDFLCQLHERLGVVEETVQQEWLREPENIALFEEGAYQAARAFSEERRRQIAELVAGGIADDRRNYLESHRVLRLLGELDDAEVIILAGYLQKHRDGDYWKRHAGVLQDSAVHLGSSRDQIDADTVRNGRQHLVQLGLLDQGALGAASIQLNGLGRLLLRRIGLAGDND